MTSVNSRMEISESSLNLIAEGSRLEGKIRLDQITRVHGAIVGEIEAPAGSTLIIAETGWVEGNIQADTVLIDGFVRGDISAQTKVTVSGTGRVLGNIRAPKVALEFGSHFEGSCRTEAPSANPVTANPAASTA